MEATELARALQAAQEAAAAAGDIIRHYWRQGVEVELKSDQTPVTVADREAELAIREILQRALPQAGIYGEEFGRQGDDRHGLWLIDPLDGTKSFVRRTPFFSTQIALMVQGELLLGVSSAPVYGETMWASRGQGAWLDGQRVTVADTSRIEAASVSTGNIKSLASGPRWPRLGQLISQCNRIRGYGDFCHYHLLARGSLDLVIESEVGILDVAALAVIVAEAGGVISNLEGAPLDLETRSIIAATPALHAWTVQQLQQDHGQPQI